MPRVAGRTAGQIDTRSQRTEQPACDIDAGAAPGFGFGFRGPQAGALTEQASDLLHGRRPSPSADGVAHLIAEDGTGAGRANRPPWVHGALRNHGARDYQKQRDGQRHSDGGDGHDSEQRRRAIL